MKNGFETEIQKSKGVVLLNVSLSKAMFTLVFFLSVKIIAHFLALRESLHKNFVLFVLRFENKYVQQMFLCSGYLQVI